MITLLKLTRQEAKEQSKSRDCSCVLGKNRDNNYNECIDKIYSTLENIKCKNCVLYGEYTREIPGAEDFTVDEIGCIKRRLKVKEDFFCADFKKEQ